MDVSVHVMGVRRLGNDHGACWKQVVGEEATRRALKRGADTYRAVVQIRLS